MAHCNPLFPQELKNRRDAGKDVTFPQGWGPLPFPGAEEAVG